jgi:two-component system chemotaxis response regulator CheB
LTSTNDSKIRVLVVDDSATVRRLLTRELSRYPDIEVVAAAVDPYEARELIVEHQPDVVTLDLEMPRMNGLDFLAKLMAHHPLPVVVVSSATPRDGELALRALSLGAIEVVSKPGQTHSIPDLQRRLAEAIRAAAVAQIRPEFPQPVITVAEWERSLTCEVIAIGASTGGTRAIELLLRVLPKQLPGIVIAQHLPGAFTESFAKRLDALSRLDVRVAQDGDVVEPGTALIAPGGLQTRVQRLRGKLRITVVDERAVNHQAPSVDVLFDSIADTAAADAIAVILTGMGDDGARGMLRLRQSGAYTIAESEETCVVYGMPRAAVAAKAVISSAPLPEIPDLILNNLARSRMRTERSA